MKGLKNIFCAVLILACSNFLPAQPQDNLLNFYSSLAFSKNDNNKTHVNNDLRTSNYYPLKATNYIWNNSAWNFTDTTLYMYTASDMVASLTKKDSTNNFISRVLNAYDVSDSLTEQLHQFWSSGWVNNFRDTFAFDSYGNIMVRENHQWITNQWVRMSGYRYFYTYNGSGKVLTRLTVSWNTSTTVWDSSSRITSTYNGNNNVVQTIRESYNVAMSAWQLTSKTDYTYDASFVNTQATDYLWNGTLWVENSRIISMVWNIWTGDVNTSRPQNYIYQLWNGSAWDDYNRLTYTYDAFGGVVQFTEVFVSGNWRNDARLSEFYDNQYNYTGIRSESWIAATAVWDTSYEYKYIHTYDINNTIIETVYQEYTSTNPVYENNTRTVYSDFVLLSVEKNSSAIKNSAIRIYPNPVTDAAEVVAPSGMKGLYQHKIYNSLGNLERAGEEVKNNFRIQRAGLAEGLYLLHISDGKGANYFLKFIVQ